MDIREPEPGLMYMQAELGRVESIICSSPKLLGTHP